MYLQSCIESVRCMLPHYELVPKEYFSNMWDVFNKVHKMELVGYIDEISPYSIAVMNELLAGEYMNINELRSRLTDLDDRLLQYICS